MDAKAGLNVCCSHLLEWLFSHVGANINVISPRTPAPRTAKAKTSLLIIVFCLLVLLLASRT